MSISFIQQRISQLDNYLSNLDSKINSNANLAPGANVKSIESNFNKIFNDIIQVTTNVDGTVKSRGSKPGSYEDSINADGEDNFSQLPEDFDQYIDKVTQETSKTHGVDISSSLVRSVIKQESGFNPNARSKAGAEGLMQLMPNTARSVGVFNTMNPYQNLKGGVTYLAQMLQKFDGNLQKALAAYNAGPEAVTKYGGIPPYKETQKYVENIVNDFLARENYKPVDTIA